MENKSTDINIGDNRVYIKPEKQDIPLSIKIMNLLSGKWRLVPVLIILALIWIFFAIQSPSYLSSRNLSNLSLQIVVTAIMALGMVLLLIIKEIDLSVAAVSAVCGAVVAKLTVEMGMSLPLAILIGVALGSGIGFVQGYIVTFLGAPSLLVTLGTSLAFEGLLLKILPTENLISLVGQPITKLVNTYFNPIFSYFLLVVFLGIMMTFLWQSFLQSKRSKLDISPMKAIGLPLMFVLVVGIAVIEVLNNYRGVSLSFIVLVALLSIVYYLCSQTAFGIRLYGLGSNPEAIHRAGIGVNKTKLITFMMAGALAAIAGIIAAARIQGVSPDSADPNLTLEAVAAAVIGGASLAGGRGSAWSALLGALVIGSITNGLYLMEASTPVRLAIQGGILILAVTVDALITRSSKIRK